MKNTRTLLGVFVLVLLAVIGGLHLAQGPKTTPATSTPKARSVSVAVPAAKPVAVADPVEAQLNVLGYTGNGLATRVSNAQPKKEGGSAQ